MAFKNRGKLAQMRKGKQQDAIDATSPTAAADGNATPNPATPPVTPPI